MSKIKNAEGASSNESVVTEPQAGSTANQSQVDRPAVLPTDKQIDDIIHYYSKWAFAAGALPLPTFDLVATTGVQVRMIQKIGNAYGKKFSETAIRNILVSILGGSLPQTLTRAGIASSAKSIPLVGTLVGWVTMPTMSFATTVAVGRTFAKHFESGGTLLNVNFRRMKSDTTKLAEEYQSSGEQAKVA